MPTNGYRNTNLAGCCPDVVENTSQVELEPDGPDAVVGSITVWGVWDRSSQPGLVLPLQAEIWTDPGNPPVGTLTPSGPVTVTDNGPGQLASVEIPVVGTGAGPGPTGTFYLRLINGEGCGCIVAAFTLGL